ncbi:MAG: DNA-formamidopyrimidine glycosylase [Mycoplasmoidaceae bacterium]|nr:MAG: DNA-formamidopyrimidine glycosylase [Mycoplasmoidaceae bacterium]
MPELPEVQTVINSLKISGIMNKPILGSKIYVHKILKNSNQTKFNTFLLNEKIVDITRIGKYIVFNLSSNKFMLFHLRLEGKLFVEKITDEPKQHICAEISIKSLALRFYDFRKFGTIHVFANREEMLNSKEIKKIAIDPLNAEFCGKYLFDKIKHSSKFVKTAILDQSNVSGIGNIYADEILFGARISPLRKCNNISLNEYTSLASLAKTILLAALEAGGSTISTFETPDHTIGSYQDKLMIHKKTHCPICNNKTIFIKVNGRGTHHCSKCQK